MHCGVGCWQLAPLLSVQLILVRFFSKCAPRLCLQGQVGEEIGGLLKISINSTALFLREGSDALRDLELNYILLAARMPQERSLSLLNQALFLQLVQLMLKVLGLHSQALRENPGETAAIRGYAYYVNQGLLGCISPVQQRVQDAMRKKKGQSTMAKGDKGEG